ncbi:hypothetical protein [Campylobacter subantarcticus]|uniref:Sugar transferase n=1 Tax=Campylobacter subantarcticus LMG 24374 TaxID=1388751 RepID=A0A0A8HBA8_9BACT|nr:hypothetical protein [Campylobacter subantarcticus]AJC90209.1 hypothetical protein CSUB8521_0320 [Campylobacter subantarcticus LMG 24374]
MKKIVLLGASNSLILNGLQSGLRDGNVLLHNLSIGGSSAISKIYILHKKNNIEIIKNADLVILETSIVDLYDVICEGISIEQSCRNIKWLFQELYFLNSKILNLLLFEKNFFNQHKEYATIIHNVHKQCCCLYGVNCVDMHTYYINNGVSEFYLSHPDPVHQIATIMYNLGKNITRTIDKFKFTKKYGVTKNNPKFLVYTSEQFISKDGLLLTEKKDFQHMEKVCSVKGGAKLKFSDNVIGFRICAIHVWNKSKNAKTNRQIRETYSSIVIENSNKSIVKNAAAYNFCFGFYETNFVIDEHTYVYFNSENLRHTEKTVGTLLTEGKNNILDSFGIVAFLLADQNGKFDFSEEIELIQNENIVVDSEYDFTHLVPPVEDYKTAIEEYNIRMDPIKLQPLQNQISILNSTISSLEQNKIQLSQEKDKIQQDNIVLKQTLNSLPIKKQQLEISNLEQDLINKKLQTRQLSKKLGIRMNDFMPKITMINPASAKARIQNQLSYKLGQAMIVNSKSFLGYIRMPFVLSYIKDKHKQEQKIYQEKIKKDPSLALPPLESYPDYQEALKLKNHLSYKLGQALMQANKTWYGGGYIKLLFEIRKLKKKFK